MNFMMEKSGMLCRHCGKNILLAKDKKSGKCSFCENEYYFASAKTEEKIRLINEADELRRLKNFEEAFNKFRKLAENYPDDAEIRWGAALSAYGVVFFKNEGTNTYALAVERIVERSIFFDENYLAAVCLAATEQKNSYRNAAFLIDALQENALNHPTTGGDWLATADCSFDTAHSVDNNQNNSQSIDSDLCEEKVAKVLQSLVKEKHHYTKGCNKAQHIVDTDRAAMRRASDQRKSFESEKERIDRILNTPDYHKKQIRQQINSYIWIRILLTVFLCVFTYPLIQKIEVNEKAKLPVIIFLLALGLLAIWYRQLAPISQTHLDKKKLVDSEREKQLREQIIQCEMQISNYSRKFEKSKQELAAAESKLAKCEATIDEYIKIYDFAAAQLEKINNSFINKITLAASDSLSSISNGINSVKDSFKN